MSPVATPDPKPPLWPVDMPLEPRPRGALWIGVAGKGGSGKSVLAGTLARVLGRRGYPVLAIDSDPMPGLAHSLGVREPETPLLMEAAEKPEKGPWRLKPGVGPMTVVRRYTTPAPDGVRMLQLGKAGKDGLNPVTGSVNAFLGTVRRMHEARSLHDWAVVGDLPAGPRQLAAGFSPYARIYVVVVEATVVDVRESLEQFQVLLNKNSIQTLPVALGEEAVRGVATPAAGDSELAVYIESDATRMNAALADLGELRPGLAGLAARVVEEAASLDRRLAPVEAGIDRAEALRGDLTALAARLDEQSWHVEQRLALLDERVGRTEELGAELAHLAVAVADQPAVLDHRLAAVVGDMTADMERRLAPLDVGLAAL
ncbi:MAG: hypothetical protein KY463_14255, partial [Actinobacteria bacterium]|nr:hypothetical protein [Actinomycetota bacterium]